MTPELGSWAIEHVQIDARLPDIAENTADAGVLVVFWLSGVPLGKLELSAKELPLSGRALEALIPQIIAPAVGDRLIGSAFHGTPPSHPSLPPLRMPLPDIGDLLDKPDLMAAMRAALQPDSINSSLSLSVVVCTRDRPEQLEVCLNSLEPNLPFIDEIIVVDNGSTGDAVRHVVNGRPKIDYVREARPGLSVARNTGIARSRGDIIAFTDDDAVVHDQWAARIRGVFVREHTMCVTGQVFPLELKTEAQVAFERSLGGFGQGFVRITYDFTFFERMKPFGVPVWNIGAGANMAIRRSAIDRVGGFDERLGAGASGCSEDSEFWYRVLAAGFECKYEPAAVVFHCHRRQWSELRSQMRAYMRGHVTALLVQFAKHGHFGNLRRLSLAIPKYYAKLLVQGLRRRFAGRYGLLGEEIAGCVLGTTALPWAVQERLRRLVRESRALNHV